MSFHILTIALVSLFELINAQECGTTRPSSRIVGGQEVGSSKYPWFAMLRAKLSGDPPVCAGALITPNHVLTAAHCFTLPMFEGIPPEDHFNVDFGIYDWCEGKEEGSQRFKVSKVDIHEDYSPHIGYSDIAIMHLKTPADITPVCLPDSSTPTEDVPAHIAGWGLTDENNKQGSCKQMEADVTRYTREECGKTDLPKEDVENPTVFCGGADGIDTCEGDSGGPFLTYNDEGNFVVSGIVSFGYGCGRENMPGVYADVPYFLEWIADKIGATIEEEDSRSEAYSRRLLNLQAKRTGKSEVLTKRGNRTLPLQRMKF